MTQSQVKSDLFESGNAIIEFLIVLPLMVTLLYSSVRYSVLISAVPIVEHNISALLHTFEEPGFIYSFEALSFDPAAVTRNIARTARTVDPGPGTKQATAILGLEGSQHGVLAAAYRCDCGGDCSQLVSSTSYNSGVAPNVPGGLAAILQSCTTYYLNTVSKQLSSTSFDCLSAPVVPSLCYGVVVEFNALLFPRSVGGIRFETVKDTMADQSFGAGTWRAGAKLVP